MQKQTVSRRNGNGKDTVSVLKTLSSVSVAKISQKRSTTRSTGTWVMVMLTFFWHLWLQSAKAWTLPTAQYACTFTLKLPQFCCTGRHCSGTDPCCSPYLLQAVINPSFTWSLAWLCLLDGWVSRAKRQTQFLGNKVAYKGLNDWP